MDPKRTLCVNPGRCQCHASGGPGREGRAGAAPVRGAPPHSVRHHRRTRLCISTSTQMAVASAATISCSPCCAACSTGEAQGKEAVSILLWTADVWEGDTRCLRKKSASLALLHERTMVVDSRGQGKVTPWWQAVVTRPALATGSGPRHQLPHRPAAPPPASDLLAALDHGADVPVVRHNGLDDRGHQGSLPSGSGSGGGHGAAAGERAHGGGGGEGAAWAAGEGGGQPGGEQCSRGAHDGREASGGGWRMISGQQVSAHSGHTEARSPPHALQNMPWPLLACNRPSDTILARQRQLHVGRSPLVERRRAGGGQAPTCCMFVSVNWCCPLEAHAVLGCQIQLGGCDAGPNMAFHSNDGSSRRNARVAHLPRRGQSSRPWAPPRTLSVARIIFRILLWHLDDCGGQHGAAPFGTGATGAAATGASRGGLSLSEQPAHSGAAATPSRSAPLCSKLWRLAVREAGRPPRRCTCFSSVTIAEHSAEGARAPGLAGFGGRGSLPLPLVAPPGYEPVQCSPLPADHKGVKYDLVLSSGFLAFANHCGFLQAGAQHVPPLPVRTAHPRRQLARAQHGQHRIVCTQHPPTRLLPLSCCSWWRRAACRRHYGDQRWRADWLAVRCWLRAARGGCCTLPAPWCTSKASAEGALQRCQLGIYSATHQPANLLCLGLSRQIVEVFANSAPIERLACSKRIWEGVLSMQPLIEELHTLLPASFADLQRGEAGQGQGPGGCAGMQCAAAPAAAALGVAAGGYCRRVLASLSGSNVPYPPAAGFACRLCGWRGERQRAARAARPRLTACGGHRLCRHPRGLLPCRGARCEQWAVRQVQPGCGIGAKLCIRLLSWIVRFSGPAQRSCRATLVRTRLDIPVPNRPAAPPQRADREDGPFIDGGIKCRIGLDLWRQQRYGSDPAAAAPAVVHLIGRSSPFSGNDNTAGLSAWGARLACARAGRPAGQQTAPGMMVHPLLPHCVLTALVPCPPPYLPSPVPADRQNAVVVKSPKSGGSFFSYGDYETQFEAARQRALPVLRQLLESDSGGGDQGGRSSSVAGAANGVVPSLGLTGSGAGSGLATTSSWAQHSAEAPSASFPSSS